MNWLCIFGHDWKENEGVQTENLIFRTCQRIGCGKGEWVERRS